MSPRKKQIEALKRVLIQILDSNYKEAAYQLFSGFTWRESPEGFHYWSAIYNKLRSV